MEPEDVLRPLGLFVVVLVVLVTVTAIVSLAAVGTTGEAPSQPDGQTIDGQSPAQFQPESVEPSLAPNVGEITVEETNEPKRILVDTSHSNQFSPEDFEPLTEALFEAGHTIAVSGDTTTGDDQFGTTAGYNATLEKYDAVIIIQPTTRFEATELAAVQNYTAKGGRVLVMGEPSQTQVGTFTSTTVSFGADNLTAQYGVHMGSETIFNLDENATDNNFKSIFASPSSGGELTDGVETVSFDSAGYISVREDSDAEVLFRADEGATTLQTRRTARYPTVVRNGNVAFVADSSFIDRSELRDVDNEVFVSNLLNFLVEGERPDLVEDDRTGTDTRTGTVPTLTPVPEPGQPPASG
jgi:hypothetical protein